MSQFLKTFVVVLCFCFFMQFAHMSVIVRRDTTQDITDKGQELLQALMKVVNSDAVKELVNSGLDTASTVGREVQSKLTNVLADAGVSKNH